MHLFWIRINDWIPWKQSILRLALTLTLFQFFHLKRRSQRPHPNHSSLSILTHLKHMLLRRNQLSELALTVDRSQAFLIISRGAWFGFPKCVSMLCVEYISDIFFKWRIVNIHSLSDSILVWHTSLFKVYENNETKSPCGMWRTWPMLPLLAAMIGIQLQCQIWFQTYSSVRIQDHSQDMAWLKQYFVRL